MSGRGKGMDRGPGPEIPAPAESSAEVPPAPESLAPPQRLDGEDRIYMFADSLSVEEPKGEASRRELETWVTFRLGDETYAFPVTHVQEILLVQDITRVPHAPKPVRGVTNMRGHILPVVDLRIRLTLPKARLADESRILVASSRGRLLGLLVDSVRQVVRLDRNTIQPPPDDVVTDRSDYILGVCNLGGEIVFLLDVDRVLLIKD